MSVFKNKLLQLDHELHQLVDKQIMFYCHDIPPFKIALIKFDGKRLSDELNDAMCELARQYGMRARWNKNLRMWKVTVPPAHKLRMTEEQARRLAKCIEDRRAA